MKLLTFAVLATTFAQDEVTINWKEKQKVDRLKKNYAKMLDMFFINNPGAAKPVGAVRFGTSMKVKMAKWHDVIVDSWHRCGRASLDPTFERSEDDIRFNHYDPFQGMAQLTNQYKKFITNQIHNGCRVQARERFLVSISH